MLPISSIVLPTTTPASTTSTLSPPTSPESLPTTPVSPPHNQQNRHIQKQYQQRRLGLNPAPLTIKALTGAEHCPARVPSSTNGKSFGSSGGGTESPVFNNVKRRLRPALPTALPSCSQSDDDDGPCRPRISSVTDASAASPDASRLDCHVSSLSTTTAAAASSDFTLLNEDGDIDRLVVDEDDEDATSTYSHASAVNLDDFDDDDLADLRQKNGTLRNPIHPIHNAINNISNTNDSAEEDDDDENGNEEEEEEDAEEGEEDEGEEGRIVAPPDASNIVVSRQVLDMRRQSFANSFARAREAAKSKKALVTARPELQPHNRSQSLMERCVNALAEALDVNVAHAKTATERFVSFSALYTTDERQVIADLLRLTTERLRNESPTSWRTPLWGPRRPIQKQTPPGNSILRPGLPISSKYSSSPSTPQRYQSQQYPSSSGIGALNARRPWIPPRNRPLPSDTLVRSVVYGAHVIPGAQSAEAILLRMAGEYHREEVKRRANRAERIDVPLSFALTLTAALAVFARLDCSVAYRRYWSRNSAFRRTAPQAVLWLKTRYDGLRLSFGVTLHGDSPCTVLFKRPRIFSLRKIDDYATLVTEAKDVLSEFGRDVLGSKE